MNSRWALQWTRISLVISLGIVSAAGAGCATLKALANPKATSAAVEDAGMGVVVRRAYAAMEVSREVDRLLVSTPVDEGSAWLAKVHLDQASTDAAMDEAGKRAVYGAEPARILPVEAWASVLPKVTSEGGGHASLLGMISAQAADEYKEMQDKGEGYSEATAKVADAQAKLEDRSDDLDPITREQRNDEIDDLKTQQKTAREELITAARALAKKLKEACAKVSPSLRDKLGIAVQGLWQAIDDAKTANGAALLGYPLARQGLSGNVQVQARIFCADYIEQKTGKRPDMRAAQLTVTLDGLLPTIKIDGLGQGQLGGLSADDVKDETVDRTERWLDKAATLTTWATANGTYLGAQADVLDAISDGFESAGWKRPQVVSLKPKDAATAPRAK